MDDKTNRPATPKRRLTLRLTLAISLGLNLLFIGAIAGAMYRNAGGPGARGPGGPGIESYAAPYVRALPRATRRALHDTLRAEAPLNRRARRALYQRMLTALRADPFDQDAVMAVLTIQKQAVEDVQRVAYAAWLKEIATMSPQDRIAYADKLENGLKRGPGRRKRRERE